MSLEHRKILPNMHFEDPNPKILFDEWKLRVPTEIMDWPHTTGPCRASVNSFGFGGANAHAILDSFPSIDRAAPLTSAALSAHPQLLVITGHTEAAATSMASSLADFVEEGKPEANLKDLAFSLSTRRTMHKQRSFIIAENTESAVAGLRDEARLAPWTTAPTEKITRIGFTFTGQ